MRITILALPRSGAIFALRAPSRDPQRWARLAFASRPLSPCVCTDAPPAPTTLLGLHTRAGPPSDPPALAGLGGQVPLAPQGGATSPGPRAFSPGLLPRRPPHPTPLPPPRSPHSSRGRTRQSPRTSDAASGDGAGPRGRARPFPAPSSLRGKVIPGQ